MALACAVCLWHAVLTCQPTVLHVEHASSFLHSIMNVFHVTGDSMTGQASVVARQQQVHSGGLTQCQTSGVTGT